MFWARMVHSARVCAPAIGSEFGPARFGIDSDFLRWARERGTAPRAEVLPNEQRSAQMRPAHAPDGNRTAARRKAQHLRPITRFESILPADLEERSWGPDNKLTQRRKGAKVKTRFRIAAKERRERKKNYQWYRLLHGGNAPLLGLPFSPVPICVNLRASAVGLSLLRVHSLSHFFAIFAFLCGYSSRSRRSRLARRSLPEF
jgi:hypothetical protein